MTEQEARAALRPLGYRLSQRNGGFVILDGSHRYVRTGYEAGGEPEIALDDVAEWLSAGGFGEPAGSAQRPAILTRISEAPPSSME